MRNREWRVAVVGAGVGGLALALALRERGIDAQLYERADELREVGAAVYLAANATRFLRRFGLADEFEEVSWHPTGLIFREGRSGEVIGSHRGDGYERCYGAPGWAVHRAELQRILSQAVGAEHIHLGKELADLSDDGDEVTLTFTDGTQAGANLVVGADGARSLVRQWLVGHDDKIYTGRSGFRGLVPAADLPTLPDPGALQFWIGPGGHLIHYPIGAKGDIINFLLVKVLPWTSDDWTVPAQPGEHLAHFEGWHPAVIEMISRPTFDLRWALNRRPPLRRWSKGRVTVLGDAAHALVPHHGQGANTTVEDAVVLARCLADGDARRPGDALEQYQDFRQLRTARVQKASYTTAEVLHLPDGPEARARNVNLASTAWMHGQLDWIHSFDADPLGPAGDSRSAG